MDFKPKSLTSLNFFLIYKEGNILILEHTNQLCTLIQSIFIREVGKDLTSKPILREQQSLALPKSEI